LPPRDDPRADEPRPSNTRALSATDRPGLQYSIARGLAEHRVGVPAARINTRGARVEAVFMRDGTGVTDTRLQIQVETELL
ncbi:hypothetical protein AAHH79_38170, partial [Burkholderia pseudomallei]